MELDKAMQIAMQGLTKVYRGRVHALNGVNLTIRSGTFGLLGPNGAGKTTLMRILAGILHPTDGSLKIDGQEVRSAHDRTKVKRMLGYLPQELGLYPDLTAREFLDYLAILKGIDQSRERRTRIDELLGLVGLSEVAGRKLKAFSGGMKRRVGIAHALLNDPRLLIVDEPTAGLDPEERIRFRNLLADLGGNRVVLLSTHIVEDVAQTCRDLAILTQGRVIFQGSISSLLSEANGHVWLINGEEARPEGDLTLVSTVPLAGGGMQYRIVGTPPRGVSALPVQPSLEDGYVWLMRDQRVAVTSGF
jgi:ABC-2 type transport system ATP-binding protein